MAKFSKAHYIALAKVIKETHESLGTTDVLLQLTTNLAKMLAKDNLKFDVMRFFKACSSEEINENKEVAR